MHLSEDLLLLKPTNISLPIIVATTIQYPNTAAKGPLIPLEFKKANIEAPTGLFVIPPVCVAVKKTYAKEVILIFAKKADTKLTLLLNKVFERALPKNGRTIHINLTIIICILFVFIFFKLRSYFM